MREYKRVRGFVVNKRSGHPSYAYWQKDNKVNSVGFTHNKYDIADKQKLKHNIDPKDTSDYDEREYPYMDFDSKTPFVVNCGYLDYNQTANQLTIKMYCEKDGVLTVECSDKAGFFVENAMFSETEALR